MKFGHFAKRVVLMIAMFQSKAIIAKSSTELFDAGFKKYMAANCIEAMDPLFQSSQSEADTKDRALLYLAHCQSIYARNLDAAYNLENIKSKNLLKEDQKLYKDLMTKHKNDIDTLHKIYFNLTPYAGQGSNSPNSVKGASSFVGASVSASRPTWSIGLFYEDFKQKMTPASYEAFSQKMMGANLGYFVLPSWRVGGSYTSINGSNDQLKTVSVAGVQTDYYITPLLSVFLEYYSSNYPKLMYDSSLNYKYAVTASQIVGGVGFPIFNQGSFGVNGSASYSSITLSKDSGGVALENLENASRYELGLSSYFSKLTAGISYWGGKEVLGVRSRGAVVMDTTQQHKGGSKFSLGYTINKYVGVSASYGMETYRNPDVDGKYRDFQSSTTTGMLSLNW